MSQLQKKCVVASTGVHLLLVVIVFVGSGFHSAPKKAENLQELNFFPQVLVDSLVSGGGRPRPSPPAPAPALAVAQPEQATERIKQPDPPKDQPKSESLELPKKQKLAPENLKIVSRNKDSNKSQKKSATSDNQDRKMADARLRASQLLSQAARGIKESSSSATEISEVGPGGDGPTYANYKSWIYTVYLNAWVAPSDATSDSAVVEATVTIARDGTVTASGLSTKSGDPQMDASVQRTLNRVTTIGRPFPEGVKESERTYVLRFDIKTKRGTA